MKKKFYREASGLLVKGQRGRSKSRGPKRDQEASNSFTCYFCKKSEHIKKNCMKYKKMLKKKDSKDSDGLVPMESQIKSEFSNKQMIIPMMPSQFSQEKVSTQMLRYLTRGAHNTCA